MAFTQIPYQTVVFTVGSAAEPEVARVSPPAVEIGIPAKVVAEGATLLLAVVGPDPNPAKLSTR